jgi:asparagine synthase (glutamine-hydrolysing)
MCGFVGVVNAADGRAEWLTAGCESLSHRGPDDVGSWRSNDGHVALAHRRLSIIDLSYGGHQPMHTRDGCCTIAFNGEIYNFKDLRSELVAAGHNFRSQSDTEVVLAAYRQWGTDCLQRLNGMFAFALYDNERGSLFLARDRAGEKPLFYSIRNGVLSFGSELKALLADPSVERRVDLESLDCYLTFGFVPSPRCIIQDVHKLPPAHGLSFDVRSGHYQTWRYWQLPPPIATAGRDEAELIEELEHLLEDAVRRQLVADVPVGVLLSGGVDSSLVTALAVRSKPDLRTFTVRFPGYGAYDETEHARLIARGFNTNHLELEATDPPVAVLPILARQFDEPIADSSMVPTYLVSKLTREHCKVALGGDGGDELFAGYPHYRRLLWLQRRSSRIPRVVRETASSVATLVLPVGFRGRNWTQALSTNLQSGLPHIAAIFDRPTRRHLMSKYRGWRTLGEEVWLERLPVTNDLLQRATRMDFENYLPEDILAKVDRASMLTSLEVRAPLLDYRIIEFAFGKVPSHLKATPVEGKILLKRLAKKLLPRGFDHGRKQGFSIPLGTWLRSGPWQEFFADVLQAASTFDKRVTSQLMSGQAKGRANHERLFALVMFELWRQEYRMSL